MAASGFYLAKKWLKFMQLVLRKSLSCGRNIFESILQKVNYVSNVF